MDRRQTGILLVIVAGILSGVQPIAAKFGVASLDPVFLAAVAAAVTSLLILPWVAYRGDARTLFAPHIAPKLVLIGFFSTVFTTVLLFTGASLTTGINAALLIQVEPLYAVIIGAVFLDETVTPRKLFWTLVLVIGAGIVAYNGSLQLRTGDLLVLLAPLGWTIGSSIAKQLPDVEPETLVAGRYLYAALILAPLVPLLGTPQFSRLHAPDTILAVFAVGLLYAVGLLFYYRGLKRIRMSTSITVILPVMALTGLVLAWPVLGETPSSYQIGGAAAIILGLHGISRVEQHRGGAA